MFDGDRRHALCLLVPSPPGRASTCADAVAPRAFRPEIGPYRRPDFHADAVAPEGEGPPDLTHQREHSTATISTQQCAVNGQLRFLFPGLSALQDHSTAEFCFIPMKNFQVY